LVETDESVVLTLGWDAAYIVGTPSSASVTIVSDDVPPDLIVSSLTVPSATGAGLPISIGDWTRNQGNGPSDASVTGFYLSTNAVLDAADVPIGTRPVPALAVGGISSTTTTFTVPATTAVGSYYVIAKADNGGAIVETQEGNNTRAAGLVRIGPDLAISSFTTPATAGDGYTLTVWDITADSGGADAGPSRTAVYLSANAALDVSD